METQQQLNTQQKTQNQEKPPIETLTGEGNKTEKKLRQRAKNAQPLNTQPGTGKEQVL